MPVLETNHFGPISFEPESVFEFPHGLPGFEERRRFLPVQVPQAEPLVFLQSIEDPGLCFPTLPVAVVDPQYHLWVEEEDLEVLGLPSGAQPRIGQDVLCLAVLSLLETGPTANLLAPVVVNLHSHQAVQAVAAGSEYSHQHPLLAPETAPC